MTAALEAGYCRIAQGESALIHWLVIEKGFTERGAKKCVNNFVASMLCAMEPEIQKARSTHPEWFKDV